MTPKKVPHDSQGLCENCGKDLGETAWRYGESTGCSRKCAIAAENDDAWSEEQNGGLFAIERASHE